ncbi:DUF3089 domain-containing protein [Cytophaga aurantiaca]|uniref:DUF3089 domain-containing protein n=1 Tax=Cytophaga aurantiaca TaxID=29530 RepID=UPI00037466C5|nr:DUF3089 domain-containing protein [Cytophaga aurantiaca]
MNPRIINRLLFFFLLLLNLQSCLPSKKFEHAKHPVAPDYSDENSWAALPWRFDAADCTPQNCSSADKQDSAQVDVFYVYPTAYVFGTKWNARYDNQHVLFRIGHLIESQASVYNACAKVYAPLYRQAILKSFINKKSGPLALDLAYSDVKAAFDYYMKHWNKGRPFIIAGHSQGSNHLTRLLKEEIDGKDIQKQLVAAYLIGMPIADTTFKNIPIAKNASSVNCFISWNTFTYGTRLKTNEYFNGGNCVNPLSWKTDTSYIPSAYNLGGAPKQLNRIDLHVSDAKINNGILWVHKVKPSGYTRLGKSYHLCDYSLFYINIRENAIERTKAYLLLHSYK